MCSGCENKINLLQANIDVLKREMRVRIPVKKFGNVENDTVRIPTLNSFSMDTQLHIIIHISE